MGAFFGANLWAAGHDVNFIARGPHLQAIRDRGLALEGPRGSILVSPAKAFADPAEVGPVDAILFCVKFYDSTQAAISIRPMIGPNTLIIPVLNGVEGHELIGPLTGLTPVIGGLAYASAAITRPGVVNYTSDMAALVIGEIDGEISHRATAFRDAVSGAGFSCQVTDNILGALWDKFTLLATNAALTSVCREPISVIYREPERVLLARKLMEEIVEVARFLLIDTDPDIVEKCIERSKAFPADMYSSMYHDLIKGRPLELECLSGAVVRLGIQEGVPTPYHETLYALLKPYAEGTTS